MSYLALLQPKHLLLVILTIGLSLAPQSADAADYYVDDTGTDTSTAGTITNPLKTIQVAIDRATSGTTIYLRQGIYNESLRFAASGAQNNPITLRNYSGESAIIDGGSSGEILLSAGEGATATIGWITIEGLEIRNGHNGIKLNNAHDIIIRNNRIHHQFNQGILGNGYKVLIDRNTISQVAILASVPQTETLFHGLYIWGTKFTVTNNLIHSNLGYGLQLAAYPYDSSKHAGPEYSGGRDWLISHNTFAYQQNRAGLVLWQPDAQNNLIYNNIFFENTRVEAGGGCNGIAFSNSGSGNILINNLYYTKASKEDLCYSPGATTAMDIAPIKKDPLFIEQFDFRLQNIAPTISPAIDGVLVTEMLINGVLVKAPPVDHDFLGNPRPSGARHDIGAYEFSSTTVSPRAPANLKVTN